MLAFTQADMNTLFQQHMLVYLVTRRLVNNRDRYRQWSASGLMIKLPVATASNVMGDRD